jgi:transketolase
MISVANGCLKTLGWQKYSHEQYGLKSWGASGPYQKVYERFGITGSSESLGGVLPGG